jgi:glucokinase
MGSVSSNGHVKYGVSIGSASMTAVRLSADNLIEEAIQRSIAYGERSAAEAASLIAEITGGRDIEGSIGIAVPGLISEGRSVAFSTLIPEHSGIELAAVISNAAGVAVTVENDANSAAYGEFILGAGVGSKSLFYATIDAGVGGAFILDGKIWRGSAGFAGEFGYIAIDSEGTRLEDVASTANVIRRTRERFHQDATSSLGKLVYESITLDDIIEAAEKGDDFAQMMLERTGAYVGTAVASVINLLNIDRVILGGAILDPRGTVIRAIKERSAELSFEPSFSSTTIAKAELGARGAAIGVALIAADSR